MQKINLLLLLMPLLATGCASIVTGSEQPISVNTKIKANKVAGASCELKNDEGVWYVTSPGSVTVHRSYDDMHVVCEKDGYDPGVATVKSHTKGMMAGNILFGGIIGAAVDAGTGAGYDYPALITVQLGEETHIETAPANSEKKIE